MSSMTCYDLEMTLKSDVRSMNGNIFIKNYFVLKFTFFYYIVKKKCTYRYIEKPT